jgi:hypothetical protein
VGQFYLDDQPSAVGQNSIDVDIMTDREKAAFMEGLVYAVELLTLDGERAYARGDRGEADQVHGIKDKLQLAANTWMAMLREINPRWRSQPAGSQFMQELADELATIECDWLERDSPLGLLRRWPVI